MKEYKMDIKRTEKNYIPKLFNIERCLIYDKKQNLVSIGDSNKMEYENLLIKKRKIMKKIDIKGTKIEAFKLFRDVNLNMWICLGNYRRLKIDIKRYKIANIESLLNKISFNDDFEYVNIIVPIDWVMNVVGNFNVNMNFIENIEIENIKELMSKKIILKAVISRFKRCGILENENQRSVYTYNENNDTLFEMNNSEVSTCDEFLKAKFISKLKERIKEDLDEIVFLAIEELKIEHNSMNIRYKNILRKDLFMDDLLSFIEYLGLVKGLKYSKDIKELIKKEVEDERMNILLDKI